jgi:hypothetical protein
MKIARVQSKLPFMVMLMLTIGACFAAALPSAKADALYWADAVLQTGSVKTGNSFAAQALRLERATAIRTQPIEVAGTIGRNYVAIHCVGTTPRVTAMIMVIGPDSAEVIRVRDAVRSRILGIVRFD